MLWNMSVTGQIKINTAKTSFILKIKEEAYEKHFELFVREMNSKAIAVDRQKSLLESSYK